MESSTCFRRVFRDLRKGMDIYKRNSQVHVYLQGKGIGKEFKLGKSLKVLTKRVT